MIAILALVLAAAAAPPAEAQAYRLPAVVSGVSGGQDFSPGFRFHPFGWSADGKCAWLMSRDVEGRGGTLYTYVIYDAVQDAVVYSRVDDSNDWGTDAEPTEQESWKRCSAEVSAALAKQGIVQASGIQVVPFPLQRAGDTYTASLSTTTDPSKDASEGPVTSYTVTLSSRNRGSKSVTRKENVGATEVAVDGFILSPREPRILIVVSERTPGFEGEEESLFFYGAHLGVGFRK